VNDERRHNGNEGREPAGGLPPVELLSAYLDDPADLSDEDRRLVEERLANDAEARRALAELRLIASELGELPAVTAPRSYHLDPSMVPAPQPIVLQQSAAWYARHSGAVRWATAAAAVVFVFVLGADLVLNGVFSSDSDSGDSSMPAGQAEISVRQDDDDDAESSAGGGADEGAGSDAAEPDVAELEEGAGEASGGAEPTVAEMEEAEEEAAGAGEAPTEAEAEAEDGGATASGTETGVMAVEAPTEAEESPPAITQGTGEGELGATAPLDLEAESEDEGETTMFSADERTADALADEDDGSDRRAWRIAEFGLVVVLGLLITAMIVLPRLAGSSGRRSG
jgi:hypothetical protein